MAGFKSRPTACNPFEIKWVGWNGTRNDCKFAKQLMSFATFTAVDNILKHVSAQLRPQRLELQQQLFDLKRGSGSCNQLEPAQRSLFQDAEYSDKIDREIPTHP